MQEGGVLWGMAQAEAETDDTQTLKSIKIPAESADPDLDGWDALQDRKRTLGVTWLEFLNGEAPEPSAALPDDVREQLDEIERAAKEATHAAQSAENTVEKLGGQ